DGLDEESFQQFAQEAKEKCPVSKALAAVPEIILNATLVS
ncbi:MAG: peroxiredoxin, partial [Candidatus Promineifilaceae bacterium]